MSKKGKYNGNESLEDIIESIGKGMCFLSFIYPNAGLWNLQAEQLDYNIKGEDLRYVFSEFRRVLKFRNLL